METLFRFMLSVLIISVVYILGTQTYTWLLWPLSVAILSIILAYGGAMWAVFNGERS